MRFNRDGVPALGRTARWLNDRQHIDQRGSDAEGWNILDQHGAVIAQGGFSHLAAGGGKWADTTGAVRSNFGYANPAGKIWDIGHDGTVVETPDYREGLRVGVPGGPQAVGPVFDARAVPGGHCVAPVGGGVWSSQLGTIAIPARVQAFAVMQVSTVVLVATHSHLFLVAPQLAQGGRVVGRYLAPAPAFYPDMVAIAGGVRVGWTDTPADTGLNTRDVLSAEIGDDLTDLADFQPWPRTGRPPAPPPSPPPPPPQTTPPMSYTRRSPDLTAAVADVARNFPGEWEAARKRPDGHRDDRFIRRCAWVLHQRDPNVGLNGKRGTDVISTDALSYKNPTAPGGVEVIDVITGSHQPAWQDVTIPVGHPEHPAGVLGKFIQPTNPDGSMPDSGSAPDSSFAAAIAEALKPVLQRLDAADRATARLGHEVDALKARLAAEGRKVALKSAHGTYLTAEADGRVTHRENQPAAWQTFKLEDL